MTARYQPQTVAYRSSAAVRPAIAPRHARLPVRAVGVILILGGAVWAAQSLVHLGFPSLLSRVAMAALALDLLASWLFIVCANTGSLLGRRR